MRVKIGRYLLVVFVCLFASAAEARNVYVRLAERGSRFTLASRGTMTATDAGKKTVDLGQSAVLVPSGNFAQAGKHRMPLPLRVSGTELLEVNGRKYRGELLVTKEFSLVNVADVEDYVRGVLPAEVGVKWPMETLKAQAVISRTYVLRQSLNRSRRGYDVVDTVADQVYKGAGVENARTNQAVQETAGKVLVYGNELAFAPFHSDSGGYTATNAHVWGKNLPYLVGVPEPVTYKSPNSAWVSRIPAAKVQEALSRMGTSVGPVREIRVSDVDEGGRAKSFTFVGSGGSATVKSSLFRMAVGPNLLKSTLLSGGVPPSESPEAMEPLPEVQESDWLPEPFGGPGELPKAPVPTSNTPLSPKEEERLTRMVGDNIFNTAELMDMLRFPEKKKGYLYIGLQRRPSAPISEKKIALPRTRVPVLPEAFRPDAGTVALVIPEENGSFVFQGRGWGHGVGLSQWGAQALAREGWTAERILDHYYKGTAVKGYR